MWEEWNEGGMGKLTERRKGGEPMKKRKPLSALGKAQMEMAGSLTPDLEGAQGRRILKTTAPIRKGIGAVVTYYSIIVVQSLT